MDGFSYVVEAFVLFLESRQNLALRWSSSLEVRISIAIFQNLPDERVFH